MPRQKLNIERRAIRFYKGDIEIIQDAIPNIPYNAIIRELIHKYAQHLHNGDLKPISFDPNKIEIAPSSEGDS